MYFSYILKLANDTFYAAYSTDVFKRLQQHQEGNVLSTKKYRPVELVFYAAFTTKEKAFAFEKYLKSSSGFAFRNKRLV